MDLVRLAQYFRKPQHGFNDFKNDRIISKYTIMILLFLASISTFKRFYLSPINCWIPAEFKRYKKFINKYCWLKGLYYAEQKYESFALSLEDKQEKLIYYYQWMHFYLIVLILLFYLPKVLWDFLTIKILDFDLYNFSSALTLYQIKPCEKEKILNYLSSIIKTPEDQDSELINNLKKFYLYKSKFKNFGQHSKKIFIESDLSQKSVFNQIKKTSLILNYFLIKLINLGLSLTLFYVLNQLLISESDRTFYLREIIDEFSNGKSELSDSKIFPNLAICNVMIKEVNSYSSNHFYSFNCVLPFNLFNHKISMVLYLWILFVLIPFNLIIVFKWLKNIVFSLSNQNYNFVRDHLIPFGYLKTETDEFLLKVFSQYYLNSNGIFLLRLLESNSSYLTTSDVLSFIWNKFKIKIYN
ncbi:unnamed protein product [Brachionus calyciflorus]|uniref:Innexin n=1 Tax=Brachionus calyciflorus TaxID=104777 RepID=A0A813PIL4_9BILA|nr:unnamed protein product [Brachionus calyciflorus]